MPRLFMRIVLMALLSLGVTACANRPRQNLDTPRMFDIRGVAVTANGGVSGAIIGGVQRQTELAIGATTFAVPKARGVINVHIASVVRDQAGRAETNVYVTLSDVASGQAVMVLNYIILASSENGRLRDVAIADAIATRLRYEFGLSMPPIRPVLRIDPAISTKIKGELDVRQSPSKTVVIPLRAAPVVGADQDPILNSRTKVKPTVDPARVEPAIKADKVVVPDADRPADTSVESGAKAKVIIKPRATGPALADDDPCVETVDRKC